MNQFVLKCCISLDFLGKSVYNTFNIRAILLIIIQHKLDSCVKFNKSTIVSAYLHPKNPLLTWSQEPKHLFIRYQPVSCSLKLPPGHVIIYPIITRLHFLYCYIHSFGTKLYLMMYDSVWFASTYSPNWQRST